MKTYFLPEKNRAKLQQAFGEPLYGGALAVANQYSKFIKGKNTTALLLSVITVLPTLILMLKFLTARFNAKLLPISISALKQLKTLPVPSKKKLGQLLNSQ